MSGVRFVVAVIARAAVLLGADVDGTLLDTEPLYFECYKLAAAHLGHPEYSFDIHKHILGRAEVEGATTVLRMLGVATITPHDLLELRDKFMLERMPFVGPMPGAQSAVASLTALPQAVATSAKRIYFEPKTRNHSKLFASFSAVVCGDDASVGGKSKPDPAIFLAAAAALGVPPEECLAFEDSLAGIQSAKAAGMFVVAVPDPRLDPAAVAATAPDVTLESLEAFDPACVGVLSPAIPSSS